MKVGLWCVVDIHKQHQISLVGMSLLFKQTLTFKSFTRLTLLRKSTYIYKFDHYL